MLEYMLLRAQTRSGILEHSLIFTRIHSSMLIHARICSYMVLYVRVHCVLITAQIARNCSNMLQTCFRHAYICACQRIHARTCSIILKYAPNMLKYTAYKLKYAPYILKGAHNCVCVLERAQ